MDRMNRLIEVIRTLIEGKFSGYVKINFSQGSLGRIEKSEEFEEVTTPAHDVAAEKVAEIRQIKKGTEE